MPNEGKQKYFYISILAHIFILLFFILSFEFSKPIAVFENSNKQDVINAIVLGDTEKSKILPKPIQQLPEVMPEPLPIKPTPTEDKNVIALKVKDKKKMLDEEAKKQKDLFAKELLADIKKQHKQNKVKQKQLKTHFEKTLHEQAEKTLRQQLLDEEIRLQNDENRQAQGEVNKYKALIIQAISEKWIIPSGVNKHLYCYLKIRLAPSGKVLEVQITKTSGDRALDNSARAAVLKASPLPIPKDKAGFAIFREFVLKVKPENVLALK